MGGCQLMFRRLALWLAWCYESDVVAQLSGETLVAQISDEQLAAEVAARFSPDQIVDGLEAHPAFRGFVAWRRKEEGGDEEWGWVASRMEREDVIFQLERAAEQVLASMPGRQG